MIAIPVYDSASSHMTVKVIVDACIHAVNMVNEGFPQITQRAHYGRRGKQCASGSMLRLSFCA